MASTAISIAAILLCLILISIKTSVWYLIYQDKKHWVFYVTSTEQKKSKLCVGFAEQEDNLCAEMLTLVTNRCWQIALKSIAWNSLSNLISHTERVCLKSLLWLASAWKYKRNE